MQLLRIPLGLGAIDYVIMGGTITPVTVGASDDWNGQGVDRLDLSVGAAKELRDRWQRHGILDETDALASNYDGWLALAKTVWPDAGGTWINQSKITIPKIEVPDVTFPFSLDDIAKAVNDESARRQVR